MSNIKHSKWYKVVNEKLDKMTDRDIVHAMYYIVGYCHQNDDILEVMYNRLIDINRKEV